MKPGSNAMARSAELAKDLEAVLAKYGFTPCGGALDGVVRIHPYLDAFMVMFVSREHPSPRPRSISSRRGGCGDDR